MQRVITLDLEGVILPEIWEKVAEITKVETLRLTTRDIINYDELMKLRIHALHQHSISINTIQDIISTIQPLPNAVDFLMTLREQCEVIIVSDTFVEFFKPFRNMLHYPLIFCNSLEIDDQGMIQNYVLRQNNGKFHVVKNLQACNFFVAATGDSYNDISMIQNANYGAFFSAPQKIKEEYSHIPSFENYKDLAHALLRY